MTDTERAILLALNEHGRSKTFQEILNNLHLESGNDEHLALAESLESQGLIQNVTYQLPLTIRAELSPKGLEEISNVEK